MGMVLGRITVETPKHRVLYAATSPAGVKYEVRMYPPAVAAEVHASDFGNQTGSDFTSTGFRTLARYIGVFGTPENTARDTNDATGVSATEAIAMTAPVLMSHQTHAPAKMEISAPVVSGTDAESSPGPSPESIAMTAPVLTSGDASLGSTVSGESMAFLLPAKYGSAADAPAPKDEKVRLRDVPARAMAVETFSGAYDRARAGERAMLLVEELATDQKIEKVHGAGWELAGYNPPMTPPPLRKNEIMVPVKLVDSE